MIAYAQFHVQLNISIFNRNIFIVAVCYIYGILQLWLVRHPRLFICTTGLSIPSKRDVGGYDYDERDVFMKNSVIEHKPTDFYDVPRGV